MVEVKNLFPEDFRARLVQNNFPKVCNHLLWAELLYLQCLLLWGNKPGFNSDGRYLIYAKIITYAEVSFQNRKRLWRLLPSSFSQPCFVIRLHWSLFPKPNHQMPSLISSFLIVVGVWKEESGGNGSFHPLPSTCVCGLLCRFTFWKVLNIVLSFIQLFLKVEVKGLHSL